MSDPLLDALLAGDGAARSWRLKLALLRDWLRDLPAESPRADAQLAYVAIYLRLLGTGALRCQEDGGHHRPSHHAALSRELHALLAERRSPTALLLRRRILPWLPSYDAAFTRAEPLTRIRDIAHRNDIPRELKREIKTRLQNKLHRSADPGDLETSRELLARVEAAADSYSSDFVSELRRFHGELELFFGASDLTAMLATARQHEPQLRDAIDALEQAPNLLRRIGVATALRRTLSDDEAKEASEEQRRRRLLELRLEEQTFVWTSEFLATLPAPRSGEAADYAPALELLELLLDALALGELPATGMLLPQLRSLRARFDPSDRGALLELKALLDRCRELLDAHTATLLSLFAARVEALGRALQVAPTTIATFVEGDLRARLPFMLARLQTLLVRRVRQAAELSPWVPLVVGQARGRLRSLETLAQWTPGAGELEPVVVRLEKAEGDETIPPQVVALLLAHDLPQLSHLGVRARQAGAAFACCDDPRAYAALAQDEGQLVELTVDSAGLRYERSGSLAIEPSTPDVARQTSGGPAIAAAPPTLELPADAFTMHTLDAAPLDDATVRLQLGAKAWGLARLRRLARSHDFQTPPGVVLGAGSLEALLAKEPRLAARYAEQLAVLDTLEPTDVRFDQTLDALIACSGELTLPRELHLRVATELGPAKSLIVRSSSNVEDRPDDAGAGLYDSVIGVPMAELEQAVRRVWASLWSRRAVVTRRQSNLPQRAARMAVLIQPLLPATLAFVLHTANPLNGRRDEAYAELAVGLGETLAAGRQRGTPFRLVCRRKGHAARDRAVVETQALASFDRALIVDPDGAVRERAIDYASMALSSSAEVREQLGRRLADLAEVLERAFEGPQDVEGVIVDDALWVVQSRPQQGLVAPPPKRSPRSDEEQSRMEASPLTQAPEPQSDRGATTSKESIPWPLFGLFDLQVRGDDALFALARARFEEAGLGAEVYASHAEQLEHRLSLVPQVASTREQAMVHLPRDLDLREGEVRSFISEMARRAGPRARGLVVHDQQELVSDADGYLRAVASLSRQLAELDATPTVLIEYAVALDPADYLRFFERAAGLPQIGACLDIGHVGIYAARKHFAERRPGTDVCTLTAYDPHLPDMVEDLDQAVRRGLPAVLALLGGLAQLDLPHLHFHLHDGHPLWSQNPYGVSDHMSFLDTIAVPFAFWGAWTLPTLFGPTGLASVLRAAQTQLDSERLTMTLEIHPQAGQQALATEHQALFAHWKDRKNAERMNYWMTIIARNAELLRELAQRSTT